jgi:NAD(P)-dependent dehydrogenase (short-subunit alcohol dehydrogenase family)
MPMSKVRGYIKCSVLTARKHAAVGLVKSAAMEDGEQGIRGNAVMPQVAYQTVPLDLETC